MVCVVRLHRIGWSTVLFVMVNIRQNYRDLLKHRLCINSATLTGPKKSQIYRAKNEINFMWDTLFTLAYRK